MIKEGSDFDEITHQFEWQIPERFNMGTAVSDKWAKNEPDQVALISWNGEAVDREISYGELKDASDGLAAGLMELGLGAGDRMAIILPQSFETAISHMAIYKCGAVCVPLARLFQPDALQYRLERVGCSFVITNRDGLEKLLAIKEQLTNLKHVILVGEDEVEQRKDAAWTTHSIADIIDQDIAGFIPVDTGPDDPALIVFTSGTTGPPKGALHGHRVLLGHVPSVQIQHEFLPQPGDIAWTPADWAWAGGLMNILMPCLYLGVPVVFGGLDRFDPIKAFEVLQKTKITTAFIPPTALRLMKTVEGAAKTYDISLRTGVSGGESLGSETYAWAKSELGVTINEIYGQTECNLVLGACAKLGITRQGAIGKPSPGHEVAVIDTNGNICPTGVAGEVAIKRPDPVMFLGYWQDEKATNEKFRGDWMMTGDQCYVDEDGYYHFVGRDDDIINLAGYRVGPGEIEDCMISHDLVRLAAVVGKPDALRGEMVKAYVVLTDDAREKLFGDNTGQLAEQITQDIKAHVKSRMAANFYPREIEFVDDIPLTTTGKVIRRIFRERAKLEYNSQL